MWLFRPWGSLYAERGIIPSAFDSKSCKSEFSFLTFLLLFRCIFWCTVVFWCTVSKVNIEVEPPWVTLDDNRNNNTTTHQPSVSKSSITIIIVVLTIIIVPVTIIIVPVLLALSDTVYCFKLLMQFCCIAYEP